MIRNDIITMKEIIFDNLILTKWVKMKTIIVNQNGCIKVKNEKVKCLLNIYDKKLLQRLKNKKNVFDDESGKKWM